MSLLFGRLTQNIVQFGMTLNKANDPTNPDRAQAQADLPAAAASFRHASSLNASYLTYIGEYSREVV